MFCCFYFVVFFSSTYKGFSLSQTVQILQTKKYGNSSGNDWSYSKGKREGLFLPLGL